MLSCAGSNAGPSGNWHTILNLVGLHGSLLLSLVAGRLGCYVFPGWHWVPAPCVRGPLGGGNFPVWALPLSIAFTHWGFDMLAPSLLTWNNKEERPKAVPGSQAGTGPGQPCLTPFPGVAGRQLLSTSSSSECFHTQISPNVREGSLRLRPFRMCL